MNKRTYKTVSVFGPNLHTSRLVTPALEADGDIETVRIQPSVTANQHDIWLNESIVGHIKSKKLILVDLPVPHYLNTGDSKLIITRIDGSIVEGFEPLEEPEEPEETWGTGETEDDYGAPEQVDAEADDFDDDGASEYDDQDEYDDWEDEEEEELTDAEKFEEKGKLRQIYVVTDLEQQLSKKFSEPATEGLSELYQIGKEVPEIIGQVYAGRMKASHLQKLYKVLKAVREYHYDKPGLAILKSGKCIIEAKSVLVYIDFEKKRYSVKLLNVDSKSGTVVHNAMLTHFGDFRQTDTIALESIPGLSFETVNLLTNNANLHSLENLTMAETTIDPETAENIGIVAPRLNSEDDGRDGRDNLTLAGIQLDMYMSACKEISDTDYERFRSVWRNFLSPSLLTGKILYTFDSNNLIPNGSRFDDDKSRGTYTYFIPVKEGIFDSRVLADFAESIGSVDNIYVVTTGGDQSAYVIIRTSVNLMNAEGITKHRENIIKKSIAYRDMDKPGKALDTKVTRKGEIVKYNKVEQEPSRIAIVNKVSKYLSNDELKSFGLRNV